MKGLTFKMARAAVIAAGAASLMATAAPVAAQGQMGASALDRRDWTNQQLNGANRFEDVALREALWRHEPAIQGNAYHVAQVFAGCASTSAQGNFAKVLAAPPNSPKEAAALRSLLKRSRACTASDSVVPTQYLRGALAEQMLSAEGASEVALFDASVTPEDIGAFYATDLSASAGDELGAQLHRIAGCHAALAPGLARKVLATEPGSDEEQAAMDNLFATETRCGVQSVPEGLSVVLQRAFLADMIYQWDAFHEGDGG